MDIEKQLAIIEDQIKSIEETDPVDTTTLAALLREQYLLLRSLGRVKD